MTAATASEMPSSSSSSSLPLPCWTTALGRACRLRCPHCGGHPVFLSWCRLVSSCPTCGLNLERGEQGYWIGAYFFNLMAVETIFAIWVTGFLVWTWPSPPWLLLQLTTIGLMIVSPFACFPFSKTLFLAFDLLVRPPTDADFATPHEAAPRRYRADTDR